MMRFYYQGQEFETTQENWDAPIRCTQADAESEHEAVVAAGGLYILGTERHESRRIDNQLRGRAGRQGDPGASRFYLSLEDDLMRIFAREWVSTAAAEDGHGRGRADRARMISQPDRGRAEGGGGAELRVPQTPAGIRRRDEQAARGGVRAAAAADGGRRPEGTDYRGLRCRTS